MPYGHQAYPAQSLAPPPIWMVTPSSWKGRLRLVVRAEPNPRSNGATPSPPVAHKRDRWDQWPEELGRTTPTPLQERPDQMFQ